MIDVSEIGGPERIRPLRRSEYERLVELGVFGEERLELLHGWLVAMSPQGSRHAEAVARLVKWLTIALGDRALVRPQLPFAAAGESEPEPDVAVVPAGDYSRGHPDRALLVIEVADESLKKDRGLKARLYASSEVPEYWVVNLIDNVVEVHGQPDAGEYRRVEVRAPGETLAPAAFPEVSVRVAELIPA